MSATGQRRAGPWPGRVGTVAWIVGALAAWALAGQPWFALGGTGNGATGNQATAGLATALAGVVGAGVLLLLVFGRLGRRVVAAAVGLVGVAMAVVALTAQPPSVDELKIGSGDAAATYALTTNPGLYAAAGVVVLLGAALLAWRPLAEPRAAGDETGDAWQLLDRGEDPTRP